MGRKRTKSPKLKDGKQSPPRHVLYKYPGKVDSKESAQLAFEEMRKQVSYDSTGGNSFVGYMVKTEIILEQISLLLSLAVLFEIQKRVNPDDLQFPLSVYGMAFCLLLTIWHLLQWSSEILQFFICGLLLFIFSPMLRTLTQLYSTDTVNVLAQCCAGAHLLFYNYGIGGIQPSFAFLMCLLLSSRFKSTEQVASYLLLAAFLLVAIPAAGRICRSYFRPNFPGLGINLVACFLLFQIIEPYYPLNLLYISFVAFVTFICPILISILGNFKNVVRGPWDVATIETFE